MADINDQKYAHYPHINKKKNSTETDNNQSDVKTEKITIEQSVSQPDNPNKITGNNKKPKSKKKFYAILAIIFLLIVSVTAFIGWKLITRDTVEDFDEKVDKPQQVKNYENLDEIKHFNNYVVNDEDDLDSDGLTNGEEKKLGTDYNSFDTDKDGLSDYDEINEFKTNPLKNDTDGDTIDDGTEIALNLNPLNRVTDGTTPDNKRTFEISHKLDEGSLTVNGFANVTNIYAQKVDTFKKENNPGVVSDLYEFYMEEQNFDSATLRLEYDSSFFKNNTDYKETDLAIFQYLNDGSFKLVGGEVDTENHTVTVTLEHFSKYCLAVKPIVEREVASKVFIVLDNSGSMYPKELCETSDENDVDFKRVDFAKKLIETSDENKIQFGLAKFTADYTELCGGFNNEKGDLYQQLDAIKTTEENFNGTHIAEAIISACNNFSKDDIDHRKFIILLTDGATTEGQGWYGVFDYNENDAINAANEKNVTVIVVGLGTNIDVEYCNKIANSTNGKYIFANNSSALDDVHETINTVISNGHVDLDNDGEADHILIADSGFDISKNAFSFNNFWIKTVFSGNEIGGQCAGIAAFVQRYYLGTLPQIADQVFRYKSALFGDYLEGMPYSLKLTEFFGNGDNKYTQSKTNLKEYVLFEELHKVDTGNIWDKYQRNENDEYYMEFTPQLKEFIKNNPLLILHEKNGDGTIKTGINKADNKEYKYKYWDSYSFNIDIGFNNDWDDETKDAYHVLCALNNLWAGQAKDEWYDICKFSDDGFYKIVDWVNSGIVPICGGEGHATNLTQIYRDIENPLKYTLVLYDNENNKSYKTLTLIKTKYNKLALDYTAWTNDYKFEIIDTDGVYKKKDQVIGVDFAVFIK